MKFFVGLLKALRAGVEGAAAVLLGQLLGFFQGVGPTDVSPLVWSGVSLVAVLVINYVLGKLKPVA